MKKVSRRDTLIEHLIQPFDISVPGNERSFLSSGFCQSDESTTIFRRVTIEGDSDVCEVECSLCGGSVITYKHSSTMSSTYSPEIVACLIQRKTTLYLVLEKSLSRSDLETVEDVLLRHLAKHDFTKSFQKIAVYRSGVSSNLLKKPPHKSDLLFSHKFKSISEETREEQNSNELEDLVNSKELDREDKRRKAELVKSAGKLLKELEKLSTLPKAQKEKTNYSRTQTSQEMLKSLREKLSKAEGTSLRSQIRNFADQDSLYD